METVADTGPEIELLSEETRLALDRASDAADPESEPHRAVLVAARVLGEVLDRGVRVDSDEQRAFAVRDMAIRGVAEIVVTFTRDEDRLRLIVEDLERALGALVSSEISRRRLSEPRYEPGAAVLSAAPDMASAARVLLACPSAAGVARGELYEDLLNVSTSLLALSWRLRAWASCES